MIDNMILVLVTCIIGTVVSNELVTCTSVVKLHNVQRGVRLHSHEVKYGSGSGQQSVTGVTDGDDVNSYWVIQMPPNKQCLRGQPIKCGDVITLKHLTTNKNLHSHHFQAPMSNNHQEVSAFGEDGKGDKGDYWAVVCSTGEWLKSSPVRLRHVETAKYLTISGNTFGRPIAGQYEVTAHTSIADSSLWKPVESVMFQESSSETSHDEL